MNKTTSGTRIAASQFVQGRGWSEALDPGLNSTATLVTVFGSRLAGANDAVKEVYAAYPDSHVIGCSTSGEILGSEVEDDSVVVGVMRFARSRLANAFAPVRDPGDSRRAGRLLAEQLGGEGLRGVFVLSDGLNVNGSELVRGLNEVLPPDVAVTGGLAGDSARFEKTWILRGGETVDRFVSAVGVYGEHATIGHGSRGGWDVFGPERRVTRSNGNVLHELDGKPALALYKQYLGPRSAELPSSALLFPLRVTRPGGENAPVVRTVLAVDEAAQTMTFAGDIPEGASAQLMRANFDRLVTAAGESSLEAALGGSRDRSPILSVAISCVGRRLILGERTEEELEAAMEPLKSGDRQVGFYSYGELSPFASGRCDLHNQTMTVTTFSER